jgi:pilus assembly protein Flp/PilA
MKHKLIAYFKDESGQTSTEYILLVAVAAAIVIKFKGAITKQLMGNDAGEGGILGNVMKGVNEDISRSFGNN